MHQEAKDALGRMADAVAAFKYAVQELTAHPIRTTHEDTAAIDAATQHIEQARRLLSLVGRD